MTQLLRDGLRDLAEDAPVVSPDADTWALAQRSRRRRLAGGIAAGTAGVLVVVAAAAGMVVPSLRQGSDTTGQPTYDASQLALPTQISQPSPWESGTADAGPLGPIAVLGEDLGRHTSWFHTAGSYYGISAADGTYRYLDLPGVNPEVGGTPALSPDGSHIAYFTAPPPSADPVNITGYAIYDALAGTSTDHTLPALGDLRPRLLLWSPAGDRVLAIYDGLDPPTSGDRVVRAVLLSLDDGTSQNVPLPSIARARGVTIAWGSGGIAFWHAPTVVVLDPATGALGHSPVASRGARHSRDLTWSPDGSQLAVTALFSDPGGPFLEVNSLGAFAPPPDAGLTPANRSSNGITRVSPFDAVYQQLGWRDGTQVLVLGLPTEELAEREDSVPGIYSINIATGDYERLASVSLDDDAWIRGIATTLGANTFADRPGPTDHADPRAVWARVAALLFVAAMVGLVILQTRRSQNPARPLPEDT